MRLKTLLAKLTAVFSFKKRAAPPSLSEMVKRIAELEEQNQALNAHNKILMKQLDADSRRLASLPENQN